MFEFWILIAWAIIAGGGIWIFGALCRVNDRLYRPSTEDVRRYEEEMRNRERTLQWLLRKGKA